MARCSGEAAEVVAAGRPVPAARRQTPVTTQQEGAVNEREGEQRAHGGHTEVDGDGNSGEKKEEMVVEGAVEVKETGEVGGKQSELLVEMGEKGHTGEVAGELFEVVERTGELSQGVEKTGGLGEMVEGTGELSEEVEMTGYLGEVVERTSELSEVGERTGEVDEVVGNSRETGMSETGEAAGTKWEGAAAAETKAVGPGVSETRPGCASALIKRRSKRKNVLAAAAESCKAGRMEGPLAAAADSDSDAEANMSDCSDVSDNTTASQESHYYSEKMVKSFLQKTKGIKGLHIEKYFPDKLLFLNSARHIIKNRLTSELTNQEVFRLKKQMIKVRKELDY